MRILVTGGAGFIGSAVCRELSAKRDVHVLNVDKLTYAANLNSLKALTGNPRYSFLKADICDRGAIERAFLEFHPDAVIHLAAESHVDRSIDASDQFVQTNILGTHTLLEVARRYWDSLGREQQENFRFLHVSTDEAYGSLGASGLFREDTRYDPGSPYAATKAAADHIVVAWHRTYGFPALIASSSNNYGPYQFPEKLIPLAVINAHEGKSVPVYGDGRNVRDWLYVEDHARALFLILTRGVIGQTYNVGGRNEQTNLAIVEQICSLLDEFDRTGAPHRRLIEFVPDRPGHDRRYAVDPRKLESELGWRANENFGSGLAQTVRWYLDNPAWWRPLRNVYDGRRLGLSVQHSGDGR